MPGVPILTCPLLTVAPGADAVSCSVPGASPRCVTTSTCKGPRTGPTRRIVTVNSRPPSDWATCTSASDPMPSARASGMPAKATTISMPIENASVTGSNPRLWGRVVALPLTTPTKVMTASMPRQNASVAGDNPHSWRGDSPTSTRAVVCEADRSMSSARMRRTPVRRQVGPNCRLGAGEWIPPAPGCGQLVQLRRRWTG